MCCLSADTGERRWCTALPGRVEAGATLLPDGSGAALRPGRSDDLSVAVAVPCLDGKVYVLNARDGRVEWCYDTGGAVKGELTVDRRGRGGMGFLWGQSHGGAAFALDVSAGCAAGAYTRPLISYT